VDQERSNSTTENTENGASNCPIPATHRRLRDAHTLWHQALDHYHDPETFRANLNATIEALRNITFALQKEKASFHNFDAWYGDWRKKLSEDPTARWLNNARVTVVHRGDLQSHNVAEVRLVTWCEEVLGAVPVPIETPLRLILEHPVLLDLLRASGSEASKLEDAALLIERRWSNKELNGREILSTLADVYGLLADIVLDAHTKLGQMNCITAGDPHRDFPSPYDRTGTLRCMIVSAQARTERVKVSTQQRIVPISDRAPYVDPNEVAERYGLGMLLDGELAKLDPLALAERFLYRAKRILTRDKQHCRMMFIRDGGGCWHQMVLSARDRTEKFVLMQIVSEFVESRGCDAIIEIGELWMAKAPEDSAKFSGDIERIPGRTEALSLMVATREGLMRWYLTPIKRGRFGGIKLGDTTKVENGQPLHLRPIIDVWLRQRRFRAQDGRQSQVWEPDALDLCPCGGERRFGECCKSRLKERRGTTKARPEVEDAIASGDHSLAEQIARVALAQYVVWIKQHTAAAMESGAAGKDFYEQIVDIDALALESLVDSMIRALSLAGKTELILPQLRRLRLLVGVPRLAMRMTAIASSWLFASGRPEEAVLELDALGNVSDVKDAMALSLLAQHADLTDEGKRDVLERAIQVAACADEKQLAQIDLASHLLLNDPKSTEAISLVRSVIEETEKDGASMARSAALIFLWKITRQEEDFRRAFAEMERLDDEGQRCQSAIYLIDAGKYAEAEHLLADLVSAGHVKAKLLLIDGRIRSGARQSAGELYETIQPEKVPADLQYAHAVATSLLVLAAGFVNLRKNAITLLNKLPSVGGEQDKQVKLFLQLLG
jgi:hypothetical protein